jgi:hypothetical protein
MNEADKTRCLVIPALSWNPEFGVQSTPYNYKWIPAFAGMTKSAGIAKRAGMTRTTIVDNSLCALLASA